LVEHVVVTHIAVGKHVIAEQLAPPQAGAMAEHQPAMRSQHRKVVGDGLGVARTDPDIHQRDPAAVRAFEMIGRHLWKITWRQRLRAASGARRGGKDQVSRRHEAAIAVHPDKPAADLNKLVDVALVVRQQHEVLEMLGAVPV
jgi:hypothetical protein